jgi:hypothetical protein
MESKKKIFNKLIDEYGLDNAVKITGLSKLEFLDQMGSHIDLSLANDILKNLFSENLFPKVYKNCHLSFDRMGGFIEWACVWDDNEITYTYATPFWEDNQDIPVHTTSYVSSEVELDNNIFTNLKWTYGFENLELYEEWIKRFYLPQVYYVIQQHLDEYRKV